MKKVVLSLSILLLLAGALVFVFNRRFIIGIWQYGGQARDGTLRIGDAAPDIPVWELDGQTSKALGEHFGTKPVAIVFGSFT